jgi:hypothetical protein
MVGCALCAGRYLLRGTLLDVERVAQLSVKLIERTLHEFEADINAHESRLWALPLFGMASSNMW